MEPYAGLRAALLGDDGALRAAVTVGRAEPPELGTADLPDELPAVVDRAAAHGPVVVFHSTVLAYLAPTDRQRFGAMMAGLSPGPTGPVGR